MRCGVHTEFQLGFFAVICRQALEQERTKPRPSSSTEGVEDEEALQTRAVISQATELVHHGIDEFLADGIVTTSVCSI